MSGPMNGQNASSRRWSRRWGWGLKAKSRFSRAAQIPQSSTASGAIASSMGCAGHGKPFRKRLGLRHRCRLAHPHICVLSVTLPAPRRTTSSEFPALGSSPRLWESPAMLGASSLIEGYGWVFAQTTSTFPSPGQRRNVGPARRHRKGRLRQQPPTIKLHWADTKRLSFGKSVTAATSATRKAAHFGRSRTLRCRTAPDLPSVSP